MDSHLTCNYHGQPNELNKATKIISSFGLFHTFYRHKLYKFFTDGRNYSVIYFTYRAYDADFIAKRVRKWNSLNLRGARLPFHYCS